VKIEHTKMVRELLDYAKINDTFCLTTTQFREFENEVEEACEKQIGKKPIGLNCYKCGNIVSERLDGGNFPLELEYCPYCGEHQDWSEE